MEQLKQIIDGPDFADSTRIYMLGGSRGAMMSYMLLRKVDWIKVVASTTEVSDVRDFMAGKMIMGRLSNL